MLSLQALSLGASDGKPILNAATKSLMPCPCESSAPPRSLPSEPPKMKKKRKGAVQGKKKKAHEAKCCLRYSRNFALRASVLFQFESEVKVAARREFEYVRRTGFLSSAAEEWMQSTLVKQQDSSKGSAILFDVPSSWMQLFLSESDEGDEECETAEGLFAFQKDVSSSKMLWGSTVGDETLQRLCECFVRHRRTNIEWALHVALLRKVPSYSLCPFLHRHLPPRCSGHSKDTGLEKSPLHLGGDVLNTSLSHSVEPALSATASDRKPIARHRKALHQTIQNVFQTLFQLEKPIFIPRRALVGCVDFGNTETMIKIPPPITTIESPFSCGSESDGAKSLHLELSHLPSFVHHFSRGACISPKMVDFGCPSFCGLLVAALHEELGRRQLSLSNVSSLRIASSGLTDPSVVLDALAAQFSLLDESKISSNCPKAQKGYRILQRQRTMEEWFPRLSVLDLSDNHLLSLGFLFRFRQAGKNESSFQDGDRGNVSLDRRPSKSGAPFTAENNKLRYLTLRGNPVTASADYQTHVGAVLPFLQVLDGAFIRAPLLELPYPIRSSLSLLGGNEWARPTEEGREAKWCIGAPPTSLSQRQRRRFVLHAVGFLEMFLKTLETKVVLPREFFRGGAHDEPPVWGKRRPTGRSAKEIVESVDSWGIASEVPLAVSSLTPWWDEDDGETLWALLHPNVSVSHVLRHDPFGREVQRWLSVGRAAAAVPNREPNQTEERVVETSGGSFQSLERSDVAALRAADAALRCGSRNLLLGRVAVGCIQRGPQQGGEHYGTALYPASLLIHHETVDWQGETFWGGFPHVFAPHTRPHDVVEATDPFASSATASCVLVTMHGVMGIQAASMRYGEYLAPSAKTPISGGHRNAVSTGKEWLRCCYDRTFVLVIDGEDAARLSVGSQRYGRRGQTLKRRRNASSRRRGWAFRVHNDMLTLRPFCPSTDEATASKGLMEDVLFEGKTNARLHDNFQRAMASVVSDPPHATLTNTRESRSAEAKGNTEQKAAVMQAIVEHCRSDASMNRVMAAMLSFQCQSNGNAGSSTVDAHSTSEEIVDGAERHHHRTTRQPQREKSGDEGVKKEVSPVSIVQTLLQQELAKPLFPSIQPSG